MQSQSQSQWIGKGGRCVKLTIHLILMLKLKMSPVVVSNPACILEVPGSNLGPETDNLK
jgi:hypothetical protein